MEALLSIRDLTVKFYTYEGVVNALEGVNIDINQRETFGLVGETGSGKTMTALSILRLIGPPGRIESGTIHFNLDNGSEPVDLLTLTEDEIREIRGSTISMVFQEPSSALNPVYTMGNQIAEVILLHRRRELVDNALRTLETLSGTRSGISGALAGPVLMLEKKLFQKIRQNPDSQLVRMIGRTPVARRLLLRLNSEASKMAVSALQDVEIPDAERVAVQYPHQLSGGMKQRSVIAMALACSPRFLIADEPTTSLDVTIQAQILELLHRLKDEKNSSVLYITHDLAVAAEICDRIGVMYAGNLCEVAPVEDLFENPLHPYTRALLEAVPKPNKEPKSIGGAVPDPLNLPAGCKFHPRCSEAMPVCLTQIPEMRRITPGHTVSCHLYQGESSGVSG